MNIVVFTLFHLLLFGCQVFCVEQWKKSNIDIDFIIVGAGTAGCALASRLSENENHQVLLLEAGGEPLKFNDIPYFAPGPFFGELDWGYVRAPEKNACLAFINETCQLARGKGLGGTTLINAMIFTRGNAEDYNNWRDLGNNGWGYEDVLPYFNKMENFQGKLAKSDDEKYHGFKGPMTVSQAPYKSELTEMFIEAGRQLEFEEVNYNEKTQTGFSPLYHTIRDGLRLSTYKAYLEKERLSRPNLHIETHALVTKVEFNDEKQAVGVLFEQNGNLYKASAKKEVILSAGAVNSPQILMLSGIGPKNDLEKFNIPVVKDLPGVGKNLQDHVVVGGLSLAFKDEIGFQYYKDVTAENFEKLETQGQGPLTVPCRTLAIAFFNSEYSNVSIDWPDLELLMFQIPVMWLQLKKDFREFFHQNKNAVEVVPVLLRPKSKGEITIKSTNPHDQPVIKLNFLSEYDDVKTLISGVKMFLKLSNSEAIKKYEGYMIQPPEKLCEEFKLFSDEYLECFIRFFSTSLFHLSGTCKMGTNDDPDAVVDSSLRVRGIGNLRVVDASIIPSIISGHLMAPTIMIAEKVADDIKEYWKNTN